MGVDLLPDLVAAIVDFDIACGLPWKGDCAYIGRRRSTRGSACGCRRGLGLLWCLNSSQLPLLEERPAITVSVTAGADHGSILTEEVVQAGSSDVDGLCKLAFLHFATVEEASNHAPKLIAALVHDHVIDIEVIRID